MHIGYFHIFGLPDISIVAGGIMNSTVTNNAENIYYNLTKGIVAGLFLILVACWFWWYLVGNPLHELALIRSAHAVSGFVVDTWEEPQDTDYGTRWLHGATYKYYVNGHEFLNTAEGSGRLRIEFLELTEPYPVEVEYLPNKPEISRIKGDGSKSISEWLWRKVGFGGILLVAFLSIGFTIILNTIKTYKNSKILSPNTTDINS